MKTKKSKALKNFIKNEISHELLQNIKGGQTGEPLLIPPQVDTSEDEDK